MSPPPPASQPQTSLLSYLPLLPLSIPILLLIPALYLRFFSALTLRLPALRNKRICLLIAHPDDEAMFFAPTITRLSDPALGNTIRVLCLSAGTAGGIGSVRKAELIRSWGMLTGGLESEGDNASARAGDIGKETKTETDKTTAKISSTDANVNADARAETGVLCLEDDNLLDSHRWSPSYISSLLTNHLSPSLPSTPVSHPAPSSIDTLLTFDTTGVSSHHNHSACHAGALLWLSALTHGRNSNSKEECLVDMYALTSVNILRKYTSLFDLFFTTSIALWTLLLWLFSGSSSSSSPSSSSKRLASKGPVTAMPNSLRSNTRATTKSHQFNNHIPPPILLHISSPIDWLRGQRAMIQGHASQMLWFRWGWLVFSRYMIVNDLRRVR